MATTEMAQGSVPSLLAQAARTAAEADGLSAPKADEAAAAALTSFGASNNAKIAKSGGITALDRARTAVAAAQAPRAAATAATAGSAAHAMMTNGIPAVRKGAAVVPPTAVLSQPASAPVTSNSGGSKKKGPPLRRGKWTPEEEAYANRLIQEFKAGLLPLTDGTTLRTFLSKLLNCDPMRISKKFVGGNCIGKQVFRRRTADINRLTPEQIQQSRAELSELERRFLERVAQTNRVKSSGVTANAAATTASVAMPKTKEEMGDQAHPSPPWLQPPLGYKHGTGAAMAAAANSRAAAAGRALLQGMGGGGSNSSNQNLQSQGSAGLLAMAELHRRNSAQNLLQRASATNLLAAANANGSGLSGSAMAQMARNASAARLASLTANGNSMNNLLMKAGFSNEQLGQLAREGASSASLKNMMERQSSFDALMSLDFQSLQSIDNLANLIQTGAQGNTSEIDMKNWSADAAAIAASGSNNNLSSLASARRLASAGHMESLLRSLSSNNVNKADGASNSGGSNANFNVLQNMQSNLGSLGQTENSASGLFGQGNAASALSLASMLRADSSTGLSQLRVQDGLNQRNTSVDDFLSLVTSGDIPSQDPLLSVPLIQQQQQTGGSAASQQQSAALLAQQQLLAQASGNAALANALRSGSFGSLKNANAPSSANTQQQAQLGLAQAMQTNAGSSSALKRKLQQLEGTGLDMQGAAKR